MENTTCKTLRASRGRSWKRSGVYKGWSISVLNSSSLHNPQPFHTSTQPKFQHKSIMASEARLQMAKENVLKAGKEAQKAKEEAKTEFDNDELKSGDESLAIWVT